MSDTHPHSGNAHAATRSTTGGDINIKKIILIGVASLIIFAVSVVWSYRLMVGKESEIAVGGSARVPTEMGKPEIGIVDQVPFDIDHRLEVWRAEHARRLSSYGWVDRRLGIARIPIEKAMQQVVLEPPDISGEGVVPGVQGPVLPTKFGVPAPSSSSNSSNSSKTAGTPSP